METINPYAAPQAAAESVSPLVGEPVLARRFARLAAQFLNGIMLFAVIMVAAIPAALMNGGMPGDGDWGLPFLVIVVIGMGGWVALNLKLLAASGQSVAKKVLKIRIVRSDGTRATLGRLVFLRYLPQLVVSMIPLIGGVCQLINASLIFRSERRCGHDLLADTIVVEASPAGQRPLPPADALTERWETKPGTAGDE